jgi:pyruvate dehydrogenase E2 component (dihydrolipoamide acetyltransferase)
MGDFVLPSLGADMEEGRIVEWKVRPGDRVHRGDIVAVVDTDKADIDVEVFEDGVVEEIVVGEGERVPVGALLARIGPGEPVGTASPAAAAPPPPAPHAEPPPVAPAAPPVADSTAPAPVPHADASPVVRRLAQHHGVDLATVRGSGPGGRITRADVEKAAVGDTAAPPAPLAAVPERARDRAGAMREAIGALMARSKREIPHYYLRTEIDLEAALRWMEQRNEQRSAAVRLLPIALLVKATARAAHEFPEMNGAYVDGEFRPSAAVHVGVAVSLRQGGLVAPALHDVDSLELDVVMERLRDLVNRARSLSLRASEMADPTITVTNLGDQGVDAVFGVIYPPQVALVGFGTIRERPWARDGLVGSHRTVSATLAADHRVSDGHRGARFLSTIDRLLQEPDQL